MRKQFAEHLHAAMAMDNDVVLITADLGYGLWDKIKLDYPDRFYNPGSSEQLMIGMAGGMAMEGKIPFCYSITPFLLYRPFEFIRNLAEHERLPIKLVGGGRHKDYGYLGFTHWATEDVEVLEPLSNIRKFVPNNDEELENSLSYMLKQGRREPCYINLRK